MDKWERYHQSVDKDFKYGYINEDEANEFHRDIELDYKTEEAFRCSQPQAGALK